jgi:bla regulator protein BlaR1
MESGATVRRVIFIGFVALSAAPLMGQAVPDWRAAAGGKMSFDVASIKPSKPDTFEPPNISLNSEDYFQPTGGLFSADFPLIAYIKFAYKLVLSPEQTESMLDHMPKWVATRSFTIHARAAGDPTKDQYRSMMQSLLAERFKLVVHSEKRDAPVLALMLAKPRKLGSKLRPHTDGTTCSENDRSTETSPFTCGRYNLITESNRKLLWGSRDAKLSLMAAYLPGLPPRNLGRIVVDRTGLRGRFDFTLEWVPTSPNPTPVATAGDPDSLGPTLEEALKEQLGLKLEPSRALLQVLVIDHVELPSEN